MTYVALDEVVMRHVIRSKEQIKAFLIVFLINLIIYGQKLSSRVLASDDYSRHFLVNDQQAGFLGRWASSLLNNAVFVQEFHILPFLWGSVAILSISVSAVMFSKRVLAAQNWIAIIVFSMLFSATPFFAHNVYFATNISVHVSIFVCTLGVIYLVSNSLGFRIMGFGLCTFAVGVYQTNLQLAALMLIAMNTMRLDPRAFTASLVRNMKTIVCSFLALGAAYISSSLINKAVISINDLQVTGRYARAMSIPEWDILLNRLVECFNIFKNLERLIYLEDAMTALYIALACCSLLSLLSLLRSCSVALRLFMLALSVGLAGVVVNLPHLLGVVIHIRAQFTTGMLAALCYALTLGGPRLIRGVGLVVAVALLVCNVLYINAFYYGAERQTQSDILRVNQIVSRIRSEPGYVTESKPIEFMIVGEKAFPVREWRFQGGALNLRWSKYAIFRNFTDFNFKRMPRQTYSALEGKLISKGRLIPSYPDKGSIYVGNRSVILFLDPTELNAKINGSKGLPRSNLK